MLEYYPPAVLCTQLLLLHPQQVANAIVFAAGSSTGQSFTVSTQAFTLGSLCVLLELRTQRPSHAVTQMGQGAPNVVQATLPSGAPTSWKLAVCLAVCGNGHCLGQALCRCDELNSVSEKFKVHWDGRHRHQSYQAGVSE